MAGLLAAPLRSLSTPLKNSPRRSGRKKLGFASPPHVVPIAAKRSGWAARLIADPSQRSQFAGMVPMGPAYAMIVPTGGSAGAAARVGAFVAAKTEPARTTVRANTAMFRVDREW